MFWDQEQSEKRAKKREQRRSADATATVIGTLYRASVDGTVECADVLRRTPKQARIRSQSGWVQMVPLNSDTWFDSPKKALNAARLKLVERIDRAKADLHRDRTWLGMIDQALVKVFGSRGANTGTCSGEGTSTPRVTRE